MAQQTQTEKILNYFSAEFPHIGLTAEALRKPQFDTVFEAYWCLTCVIFGFDDTVFQPDENQPQDPLQILLRLLQRIINDTTTENFLITDLIAPKPQRFRFFICCLIDFLEFIKQQIGEVDKLFDEMNELKEDQDDITKLKDEIQKQKQKNELAKRKRLDLSSRVSQLQAELAAYQEEKDEIKDNVSNAEKDIQKKKDKIEELEAAINDAIEESRQLNVDIISSSPDKVFAEIKRTEESITELEEKINVFKKNTRDFARVKTDAEALEKRVIDDDVKMSADIDLKQNLIREQRDAVNESEFHLQYQKDLLRQIQREYNDKKTEIEEQIRKLKSEEDFIQANIDCAKQRISALQQQIDQTNEDVETKEKRDKRDMAAKVKQLQQNLEEMEALYEKRKQSVTSLMNEIESFVEEEDKQLKESTEAYEKNLAEIKNNETLTLINNLLEENVERDEPRKERTPSPEDDEEEIEATRRESLDSPGDKAGRHERSQLNDIVSDPVDESGAAVEQSFSSFNGDKSRESKKRSFSSTGLKVASARIEPDAKKLCTQSVPPGDITTQPGTKIVFNAPYDDKHTYHIKIINAGGRRIGWAIKTTNMKCLGVDPPCGVLDPKEAVLMAVSCDSFQFGAEDTNNDRITIEWINAPDGAAKQFRREWFQGDGMFRRKNLPIEYNP